MPDRITTKQQARKVLREFFKDTKVKEVLIIAYVEEEGISMIGEILRIDIKPNWRKRYPYNRMIDSLTIQWVEQYNYVEIQKYGAD